MDDRRKLRFIFRCRGQTAIRNTTIKKEDYEGFFYLLQDYGSECMEYEEYNGLMKAQGKSIGEDEGGVYDSLNQHFDRHFVIRDVEYVGLEDDIMIYNVPWAI